MGDSRLHRLAGAGQSVWSDQISRSMLDSGELARRIEEDAVTGVTSNPTIFAGAITGSDDYDRHLGELAARSGDLDGARELWQGYLESNSDSM